MHFKGNLNVPNLWKQKKRKNLNIQELMEIELWNLCREEKGLVNKGKENFNNIEVRIIRNVCQLVRVLTN